MYLEMNSLIMEAVGAGDKYLWKCIFGQFDEFFAVRCLLCKRSIRTVYSKEDICGSFIAPVLDS